MNRLGPIVALAVAASMAAQTGQTLRGVLIDPTRSPVPGALVRLKASSERETFTSVTGEFRFNTVPPGVYNLSVAVPGFEPIVRQMTIGPQSPAPLRLQLRLAALQQEVAVKADEAGVRPEAAENAGAVSVERAMLDNLPFLDNNYLSALARFLDPGTPGGSGTTIVVDGMEMRNAGVTPSAIQEIRINNNPYTVEYPHWSRRRIEVITKSSADAYHGTLNALFRDYRLNARDALATTRPQEQRRILEGSLFGPVARSKKTSFLLSAAREEEDLVAVVFARGLNGPVSENVSTPQVNSVASLRLSHQLNDQHTMFWQYNFQDSWKNNVWAGGLTLAEAATQNRFREDEFVFNHRGILSASLLSQFRLLIGRYWAPWRSNTDAVRINVSDAFIGGGAQNDRLSTEFHGSLTWLLTQTVRRHTLKYGVNVPDWSRRGLSDRANQRGALSFATLADLAANRPFASVVQQGEPRTIFVEKTIGGFVQDEWQLRPGLSLAAGLRYDWQNFFGDHNNFAPRLALAYAPGKKRKTVLRAGAGYFFDRSGPGPIWDILRFDGVRLRRYVLDGPLVPDLTGRAASVHRLEQGIALPNTMQFSAGVEHQLAKKTSLSAQYIGVRGVQQLRSRDGNAPLPPGFGTRPDPAMNVLRWIESAGRVESNLLEVNVRGELAPKVSGMVQYAFGKTMTDTGGVNWFPADSFAPVREWGRADTDRRHQFNLLATAPLHRWASFGASVALLSGLPFNVTTGRDENRDGLALDRPAGVARNTGRGPGAAVVDLRWYRDFRLRASLKDKSPSLTVSADAFNLFNRLNYAGFVGALSSPFYGRAVATLPPRRVQLALRLQF